MVCWSNNIVLLKYLLEKKVAFNNPQDSFCPSQILAPAENWNYIIIYLLIEMSKHQYFCFNVIQHDPKDGAHYHIYASLANLGSEKIFNMIHQVLDFSSVWPQYIIEALLNSCDFGYPTIEKTILSDTNILNYILSKPQKCFHDISGFHLLQDILTNYFDLPGVEKKLKEFKTVKDESECFLMMCQKFK